MASTPSMDNHPTRKLVVNSVGDILRHEKLRRLKKVLRLFCAVIFGASFGSSASQEVAQLQTWQTSHRVVQLTDRLLVSRYS